ncbi:MAG: PA14 domain-containing protein [Acidobacteriota bacterium]
MKLALAFCAFGLVLFAQDLPDEAPTFGVSVVLPAGLTGEIYEIKKNSEKLPDFKKKLKKIGIIYTHTLNIAARDFMEGFPWLSNRTEWFAIDYSGKFWIENPGDYRFVLTSDDGSRLYIDDRLVIDNDGAHAPLSVTGDVKLEGGIHSIRVSYFQGPRWHVALILEIAPPSIFGPGTDLKVFSTLDYKPPSNPADWKYPPR